MFDNV